jgi:type IV pilus assembly protein PilQ
MNWRRGLGLCLTLLVAAGCNTAGRASHPVETAPEAAAAAAVTDGTTGNGAAASEGVLDTAVAVVKTIRVADATAEPGMEGSVRVEIASSTSVDYTTYEPDPRHFVLEIPNVDLSALPDELLIGEKGVNKAVITSLPSRRGGNHARIEFVSDGILEAKVVPQGETLAVVLTADMTPNYIGDLEMLEPVVDMAGDSPASTQEPSWPATIVSGVVTESGGPGASIAIIGDGYLSHRAFTLEAPDRVVIDLPGVTNSVAEKSIDVGRQPVDRIRIAQFQMNPEPIVRVVLDVTHSVDYEVVSDDYGLRVLIDDAARAYRSAPELPDEAAVIAGARPETVPVPASSAAGPEEMDAPGSMDEDDTPLIEISTPAASRAGSISVPATPAARAAADPPTETVQSLPELEPRAVPSAPMDLGKDVVLFDRSDPDTGAGAGSVVPGGATFESQTISGGEKRYRGEKVSVTFRDADIREVFFFFGDLMKMNLVLDPDVSGRIDIRLRQVPWDQAFFVILKNQGLDAIEEDNVIRIAKTTKLRQEASERRALKLAQEQEVDPITFTRRLSYAKAQEAMTVLTQVKSDRGKIIADVRTNTVIIMDIPEKRHEYENLIDALDLQTPQVSIEARIVEAQRDFQRSLGIDWGLTARADPALGTQTNLDFPHRANLNADVNLASTTNAGTLGIALGNVLDSVTLDVTLDAFEADGKVRILSAPKVVTQNNQPANIEQGTQIPVVTTTATEIEVQYVPASLRLQVTPQITAEETVIMKVVVENNQPSDTLSVGDTPAIVTERVDTQILVRSGTTAVIGGVYKLSESDSETGIPGLRRIPFLGWLFKNKQFQKTSAELLVFLTPKIITTI